jgi:RNA polymerase sigma factor (sigma-70 family)
MNYGRLTDDELLAATRDDPDAFGAFYERHAPRVLAFLARRCDDREQALDLTAEVFAAALVASGRYRPGEAPARAWLLGIADKQLAMARRRGGRADSARRRLGMPRLSFGDAALERVDEILDAAGSGYLDGLADLTPDEQAAVTARVLDERDYAEAAAAAGTSEATMRKRVSRGLAKLAQRGGQAR